MATVAYKTKSGKTVQLPAAMVAQMKKGKKAGTKSKRAKAK